MTTQEDEKDQSYILLGEGGKSTGKHVRVTGARSRFTKNEDFCFSPDFHVCGLMEHVREYVTLNGGKKAQQKEAMSRLYTGKSVATDGSMHTQFESEVSALRDTTRVVVPSIPHDFDFSNITKALLSVHRSVTADPSKRKVRASSPRPVEH